MEDYYKVLGVAPHHSDQIIANEYKLLALKYHPDKRQKTKKEKEHEHEHEIQMTLLNRAYHVLSQERGLYDIYYRSGLDISYDLWKEKKPISHWKEKNIPLKIEQGNEMNKNENNTDSSTFTNIITNITDFESFTNHRIKDTHDNQENSNIRKKFENYEI